MGCFSQAIEIGDARGRNYEAVEALADTGAYYTIIPSSVLTRLGIAPFDKKVFILADESRLEMDIGYAMAKIGAREVRTIVVFGADDAQPLLGAYTLEELRLGADVTNRRLIYTPRLTVQP